MFKQFDYNWRIPSRFQEVKWTSEDNISFIGGVSVSNLPLLDILLISSNQEIYIFTAEHTDDLMMLLCENHLLNTDRETVDEILAQFISIQKEIGSEETSDIPLTLQLTNDKRRLIFRHGEFKFSVPMKVVDNKEAQVLIMRQLLTHFMDFCFLQSAILSKDEAEIRNKNQIIIRLLDNHIKNTSLISGLESNAANLTDKQIYDNKAVQSLFLSKSGLRMSLKSTPESLRKEVKKEYPAIKPEEKLLSVFSPHFSTQWDTITENNPKMPELKESEHHYSRKIPFYQKEEKLDRKRDHDSVTDVAKYKRFKYFLGQKQRKQN